MKTYEQSLLLDIQNSQKAFQNECDQQLLDAITKIDQGFELTQKVLTNIQVSVANTKSNSDQILIVQQSNIRTKIQQNLFSAREIQDWNQIKKMTMQLQQNGIKSFQEMNNILKQSRENAIKKNQQMIQKINEKRLRQDKVTQFSQNFKLQSKKNDKIQQRRMFSPFADQNKSTQLNIQFKPEIRQIVFRVQTFQGKIVQFLLFFDKIQGKYGLKNPLKLFKAEDIKAVKNFNIHKDRQALLKQFKDMVAFHIDNAEQ